MQFIKKFFAIDFSQKIKDTNLLIWLLIFLLFANIVLLVLIIQQKNYSETQKVFAKFAPLNNCIIYEGINDLRFKAIKEKSLFNTNFRSLNFNVQIESLSDNKPVTFKVKYFVKDNKIIETVSFKNYNTFFSIIPNKVVLQLPIREGNKWLEGFKYKGRWVKAETIIERVKKNDNGEIEEITTKTTIRGIKDYPNERYEEIRKYKAGEGLIYFENTLPLVSINGQKIPVGFNLSFKRVE